MRIVYWSDFGCPFCYIAEVRMKKALAELGIENETRIDFKAFELNPNARKSPYATLSKDMPDITAAPSSRPRCRSTGSRPWEEAKV